MNNIISPIHNAMIWYNLDLVSKLYECFDNVKIAPLSAFEAIEQASILIKSKCQFIFKDYEDNKHIKDCLNDIIGCCENINSLCKAMYKSFEKLKNNSEHEQNYLHEKNNLIRSNFADIACYMCRIS
jgi:hypothetical protein